jgi:GTPase SAR1 family protein
LAPAVHYANAKVVILGDSGVGKTGLGLVLAGEEFRPAESSHRRNAWLLDAEDLHGEQPGRREIYLWDLAGHEAITAAIDWDAMPKVTQPVCSSRSSLSWPLSATAIGYWCATKSCSMDM